MQARFPSALECIKSAPLRGTWGRFPEAVARPCGSPSRSLPYHRFESFHNTGKPVKIDFIGGIGFLVIMLVA
jgi:hypothetical protein